MEASFLDEIKSKQEAFGHPVIVEQKKKVKIDDALVAVTNCLKRHKEVSQFLPLITLDDTPSTSLVSVLEEVVKVLKEGKVSLGVELKAFDTAVVGKVVDNSEETVPKRDVSDNWYQPETWKTHIREIRDTVEFGSKIAIALPKDVDRWNGKALLLAHGFRSEGTGLIADLAIEETFLKRLLKTGWLVGMTSYRRDGRIVKEAIDDVNILRNYIVDKIGEPSLCILEGRSMGGAIATLISERYPDRYQGIVAIGAALLVEEKEDPIDFTHKPLIPLLFLTNQSELGPIQEYMDNCKKLQEKEKDEGVILPALWEVWREGHNTVSQEERYAAFQSVLNWVEHKTFITARKMNIFYTRPPKGPKAEFVDNKGAWAVVLGIHPVFKSFSINMTEADMEELRIRKHRYFQMIVLDGDKELPKRKKATPPSPEDGKVIKIFYGSYPFLVDRGTWIAFDHPDGFLCITIFGWYDFTDAAEEAGVSEGSHVFIRP